jgi:hypothetical protein
LTLILAAWSGFLQVARRASFGSAAAANGSKHSANAI